MLKAILRLLNKTIVDIGDYEHIKRMNEIHIRNIKSKDEHIEKITTAINGDILELTKARLKHTIDQMPSYRIQDGEITKFDPDNFITEINGLLDFIERLEVRRCTEIGSRTEGVD